MKRVLGVFGAGLLLGAMVSVAAIPEPEEVPEEVPVIVETIKPKEIHYLTDEELSLLYTCKPTERGEDNTVQLSYSDAQLLLKVGRSEGGPGQEGQFWCMRTIYNRYEDGWGDTLWDILNDKSQFTVVSSGAYEKADVNVASHLALAQLESGYNPTQHALYWESNSNSPHSWHKRTLSFIAEVDNNLFYTEHE